MLYTPAPLRKYACQWRRSSSVRIPNGSSQTRWCPASLHPSLPPDERNTLSPPRPCCRKRCLHLAEHFLSPAHSAFEALHNPRLLSSASQRKRPDLSVPQTNRNRCSRDPSPALFPPRISSFALL